MLQIFFLYWHCWTIDKYIGQLTNETNYCLVYQRGKAEKKKKSNCITHMIIGGSVALQKKRIWKHFLFSILCLYIFIHIFYIYTFIYLYILFSQFSISRKYKCNYTLLNFVSWLSHKTKMSRYEIWSISLFGLHLNSLAFSLSLILTWLLNHFLFFNSMFCKGVWLSHFFISSMSMLLILCLDFLEANTRWGVGKTGREVEKLDGKDIRTSKVWVVK